MRATSKPLGKATYVAPGPDRDWLQSMQRTLHKRSMNDPDYVFGKLWGFVTDPRNLRIAVERVSHNRGARTAGVDGITVRRVLAKGVDSFVAQLRAELRSGAYRPSPVRRVNIPKPGQPGKTRPLGIPTVTDRVVQAAVKSILEPIFEADFFPTSCGFRPGRSTHGAIEQLLRLMYPNEAGPDGEQRLPYQWAIEGDIKSCFDNIDHHGLMERVRRRVSDVKVNRLVRAFLKAGVLSEGQILRAGDGTPQGGILSPLLANIALSILDERYEQVVWPRRGPKFRSGSGLRTDPERIAARARGVRNRERARGRVVMFPIRYADDFIVLVGAPPGPHESEVAHAAALDEKAALATLLKERLGLELSDTKTTITPVTAGLRFLGHNLGVRPRVDNGHLISAAVIPKERTQRLRERIKDLFRRKYLGETLANRLGHLNPVLRGWANFYRYAFNAGRVFYDVDHYVWWTIFRWLKKKHGRNATRTIVARFGWRRPPRWGLRWCDGDVKPYEMISTWRGNYSLAWERGPGFASPSTESPVHNERCTPGSVGGARKPARASERGRRAPT
ncbi:MAG: RNA-directed polymerase (reverse transcriptase) [bacterium]|nr:RNA-directed polymerase (reverse transcriptase) [bacterium]